MNKERLATLEKLAAALVGFELENESDDFCGELTLTFTVFKAGVSGASSDKRRNYSKEAIARCAN